MTKARDCCCCCCYCCCCLKAVCAAPCGMPQTKLDIQMRLPRSISISLSVSLSSRKSAKHGKHREGQNGIGNRIAKWECCEHNVARQGSSCLFTETNRHTHKHTPHTHVCMSVRGILYIPFPYVCIFFFRRRRRRLHLHSMNETLFFFLVLSYSLFYSVPRLFHNAGMAGFCNPFWNIVDVLYSYIYHIYFIYYCCFMQIKFSSVFYNLKFFFLTCG